MPLLLDLANETLLQISDNLSPFDAQNFASSNRSLYHLLEPKRLASISFTTDSHPSSRPYHPLSFLNRILSSDEFATYTKEITIGPWSNADDIEKPQVKDSLCAALQTKGYFEAKDVKELSDRWMFIPWSNSPNVNWAIAISLLLLPNVRVLRSSRGDDVARCLDWLVNLKIPNRLPWSTRSENANHGGLGKLEEVHISPGTGEFSKKLLLQLAHLPCLKILRASKFYMDETKPKRYPVCNPDLRELTLTKSYVSMEVLARMLNKIENLRSFTYGYDSGHFWRPYMVLLVLQNHAFHSLTYLDLTISHHKCLPITEDLHNFSVLKEIRLSSILVESQRPIRNCPGLANILPVGIEKVILEGSLDDTTFLLIRLVGMGGHRLPCLSKVVVEHLGSLPFTYQNTRFSRLWQKEGVTVEFLEGAGKKEK